MPINAWVTLLTRRSYFPGVLILSYSLRKHSSRYPLLVLYTPSLPLEYISALYTEASLHPGTILVQQVFSLIPRQPVKAVASRFEDTWTKLRVFSLDPVAYSKLVFLDADMLILRNPGALFDVRLPSHSHSAANHACVCNLDRDTWAPSD